jgi:hypothetical protein
MGEISPGWNPSPGVFSRAYTPLYTGNAPDEGLIIFLFR